MAYETTELKRRINLKLTLKRLDALPAMPAIAQKLLALPLDTSKGEDAMLKLIGHDPQLSAKIIGLSNSPFFGSPHKIISVRDAAILLGMTRVKSVAIGIAAMSALTRMPPGRLNIQHLWLHSLAVALSMRKIAQNMPSHLRPNEDQIFLTGLLHDIGYMVLAYVDIGLSDELHARMAQEPDRPTLEVEQELLDITHCELGAQLADNWMLPPEITNALRYHHTPDSPDIPGKNALIRMINIAEKLQPSFCIAESAPLDIDDAEWLSLGINPANLDELRTQVIAQPDQASQLINSPL
ncbi:MAG: histidine kinase [Gallionellales bacterium GWA2_60_18]|nr:MAG: histidine kinase [Gallionellales bacterium GWA2_60_18]